VRSFAFLRGINVGNRRPKKDELVAAVAGPELRDVSTFQASGNVLFETDVPGSTLEPLLEERLADRLGYEVPCFVRTLDDLVAIVGDLPALDPDQKHQVVFFATPPGDDTKAAYADAAGATDDLRWRERELLWTHRGGMLESPLGDALQRLIPPVTTVRTGATLERLIARSR